LLEVSDQQKERYQQQAQKCPIPFLYKALQLLNQCDINYRQSSNKRLLVELTLIEVAQITQPDEGAGSGRKPRRLKSLFKQLVQQHQPKKAAPQVAVAEEVAPKINEPANNNSQVSSTYNPTIRPQLKSSVGFSWNNLRGHKSGNTNASTPNSNASNTATKSDENPFSQQDLEIEWTLMCNRMPANLSGIATRMKNMTPVITEFPAIELIVENQLAKNQIEDIKGSILSTLRLHLKNKGITLSTRVVEHDEQVPVMSRREQFEQMEKENPSIVKLRELLDLQLA